VTAGRRLAAIMFTDLAGYTQLTQTDEPAALRLLRDQDRFVKPVLESHRGRKVKSMGDGLLIEFSNALDAVECGVDLQRQAQDRVVPPGQPSIRMRVGIHLGDVQRRGSDIVGDAVNIASRVEPLADPGGVCLTGPVYVQVHNKVPYQLERLGPKALKGVREPIDIYRVVLPWARPEAGAGAPLLPRLAVLPLANISPDPKDGYFADGLTEELISVLSQVKGLRVISRTSVNQYRGTTKSVAQIGTELGADSVLEGSVRKAGDQLRIAVQLIDTRTDEHRWAETFDRKLENVFAIQAEVAERTAGALKVELLTSERDAVQERPTASVAAYESYLRGLETSRRFWENPLAGEIDREAEKHFDAATRQDPSFSRAYSALGTHLILVMGLTRAGRDVLPRVRQLVTKALELDPDSSEAHTARGNLATQGDQDWELAEAEFRKAIALNPSSSSAHYWYAILLNVLQRFEESAREYRAVMELDPLWLHPKLSLIWNRFTTGDPDLAVAEMETLVASYPGNLQLLAQLGFMYWRAGRPEDAARTLEPLAKSPDLDLRGAYALYLAHCGEPELARGILKELEEGSPTHYVSGSLLAIFHAVLGERESALRILEQDLRTGDRSLWAHYLDPSLDPVREDPRFVAMLRELRLPTTVPQGWAGPARRSGPVRPSRRP
jgi:adenylate cyclase